MLDSYRVVCIYKTHSFPIVQNIVYVYRVDGLRDGFYISHGPFSQQNPSLFELTYVSRTKDVVIKYLKGIMACAGSWVRVPAMQRGRGKFIADVFGLEAPGDICINTGVDYHVEENGIYTLDPLSRALLGIEKVGL